MESIDPPAWSETIQKRVVKNYIEPVTKIHSSFAEAKEYYDRGAIPLFEDEPILSIEALTQGTRNLVVGEPGVGKTLG